MQNRKNNTLNSVVVDIIKIYTSTNAKMDVVMAEYFASSNDPFRSGAEAIILQWLRNASLIDAAVKSLCAKRPKNGVLAVLRAAAADIMSGEKERLPKIVHNWVDFAKERLSKNEGGFVNAVLRRLPEAIEKLCGDLTDARSLSIKYSHPQWLIEKWTKNFGTQKTVEILESNRIPSEVFFRKSPAREADEIFENYRRFFVESKFDGFFKLKNGCWKNVRPLLDTPYFYIQDPSTLFAPREFAPPDGEYLDLCAAPGGKSRAIADIVSENAKRPENSLLVSVDLPDRILPLRENIAKISAVKTAIVECDILGENLAEKLAAQNLPVLFDGVFVDAPCSNTGVLRRRPDARYRLEKSDIAECAKKQLQILECAKNFVKVGGKLEYSTCSIEREENGGVLEKFLSANGNFALENSSILVPSIENDGAGYALLRRIS